jgi:predicted site-specific integrase-resolvase
MTLFLELFKTAAAEGAVVQLKLRLLAGRIPALQEYAHQKTLEDIETEVARHFASALSAEEKKTLRLCRQLRNKVLHSDFRAARGKLNELGAETLSGEVKKIDIAVISTRAVSKRVRDAREKVEGTFQCVGDTSSTGSGGVYGWFLEAGRR